MLSAICSYSVHSQFSFSTSGGVDFVIMDLVHYGDEEHTYASGLQSLSINSQSKLNFSKLLNATVSRNMAASNGKSSRKKRMENIVGKKRMLPL